MPNKLRSFGKDTGLQIRMATTMLLLGLVYVVFVGVLIASGTSAVVVLVIAGGLAILQLFASDKMRSPRWGPGQWSPTRRPSCTR